MSSSGEIRALKKMWLNEGGVATILPLKELEKLWHAAYDSRHHGGAFILHTDEGNIVLKNNNKHMPYLDLKVSKAKAVISLMQTVQGNMEGFTKHEVEEARKAQEAQGMLGHPTDGNFPGPRKPPNCPMTPTAVQNAH